MQLAARLRTLVFGTLLVVMPFSGMRMVCFDAPGGASDSAAAETSSTAVSDCERLCPLRRMAGTHAVTSAAPSTPESDSDCGLSADPSSLNISMSVAVLRPQEPMQVPLVVSVVSADSPQFYLEPVLAHLGPPPKPQAL